ncbi:MAG: HAMP domain-containing sensor histidine kinase [Terriglobia bacterium]
MVILLISDDRELYQLCREVLAETQFSWTLSVAHTYAAAPNCDFYIWDIDSRTALPASGELSPSKHLFLVGCDQVTSFRGITAAQGPCILLKPVTRAMLSAFLDVFFAVPEGAASKSNAAAEHFLQINLRLQLLEQDRSNFVARMAHDLRTPATAFGGYCQLLLSQPGNLNENQKEILRHMQFSANRLSRMVAAIFDLSVEGWRPTAPDFRREDLRRCVAQAVHEVGPFAVDKGISVQTSMASFERDLCFDPGLIERAFINILENACRFAPGNGNIEVRGYPWFFERRNPNALTAIAAERRSVGVNAPNSYRVDIRNSGRAIPAELLDRIFEAYIADASIPDHSGLGLAICKTIVTQHRGRLWAENTDSGPRFSIVLPAVLNEVVPGAVPRVDLSQPCAGTAAPAGLSLPSANR